MRETESKVRVVEYAVFLARTANEILKVMLSLKTVYDRTRLRTTCL